MAQVRVSKDEISPAEVGETLLSDPPSPGGSCGNLDGSKTGGEGNNFVNCPAGTRKEVLSSVVHCGIVYTKLACSVYYPSIRLMIFVELEFGLGKSSYL